MAIQKPTAGSTGWNTATDALFDRVNALEGIEAYAAAPTSTDPPGILPRVTITTTTGADPADTVTYLDATVTINGPQPYSGTTQFRGRGNSTWSQPKKPWRLKLTTAAPLLGMPTERDWVLLANYLDPLSIRNALAMEIGARCAGLAWTPRLRFVELVVNDTYRGVYQLGEQVELSSPSRINAAKASGTTGLALTGAYSMEIDERFEANGDPGFRTTLKNIPILLDDPDGTTAEQKTYIQNWINNFESVLYGSSWLDPTTGYARFIDQASFIDWYMVNELCANIDSNFYSSVKLVKSRDTATVPGRLSLGPLWDFDNSLNNNFGNTQPATGFVTRDPDSGGTHRGAQWIARMLGDPAFFSALITRWAALRTALKTGDSIDAVIDRLTDRLAAALVRDKRTWSRNVDNIAGAEALHTWLRTRINWLSTQWAVDVTPPSVPTGLTGVAGNATAGLTWTASTDNVMVVKYRVYRDNALVGEPTTTSFSDTGRTNGTAYAYQVSAVDGAGNESAKTTAVNVTPTASDTTAPSVPTGLAVTPGNTTNGLTWTASTDNVGVVKYRVRRGGTVVGEPTGTSFSDTGLTNGTAYSYTVSAVDAAGNESAQSSAVSGTPAVPSGNTETFTGADGAAWSTGWTFRNTTGTIANNKGRLAGSGDRAALWSSIAGQSGDFDMRMTLSLPTPAAAVSYSGVADDLVATNSYLMYININSSQLIKDFHISRIKAGNFTFIANSYDQDVAPSAAGWSFRLQRSGTTIRAKAWPAGDTEPSTWRVSATDSDMPTPVGGAFKPRVGILDAVVADFDNVSLA